MQQNEFGFDDRSKELLKALSLLALVVLCSIGFFTWRYMTGSGPYWGRSLGIAVVVNILLNAGIVFYFAVSRHRKVQSRRDI